MIGKSCCGFFRSFQRNTAWKRNTLPMIGRWKILDNLRRSLVAPGLLVLLVAGWTILPGPYWFWMMTALGVVASQLLPLFGRLLTGPRKSQSVQVFLRNLWRDSVTALAQIFLGVTLLAYHAFQTVHAIGLTLVRLAVTKRRLLEWETAAASASRAAGLVGEQGVHRFAVEMIASPLIAIAVALTIVALNRGALPAASPFLLLWLVAPRVAYWLSVPVGARVRPLSHGERALLRKTARSTWRYFEAFATASDGWLPPDNYQEEGPEPRLARRTSPTNIAMGLLSTLAAHDLGYLPTTSAIERLDRMLTTLEGLERHEGHFLNWYDTATLAPLHPRYVSTVDSGNLAGALVALVQGLLGLTVRPQRREQLLEGLIDTAELLAAASSSMSARNSRHELGPLASGTFAADVPATVNERNALTSINALARGIVAEARRALRESRPSNFEPFAAQLGDARGENRRGADYRLRR